MPYGFSRLLIGNCLNDFEASWTGFLVGIFLKATSCSVCMGLLLGLYLVNNHWSLL